MSFDAVGTRSGPSSCTVDRVPGRAGSQPVRRSGVLAPLGRCGLGALPVTAGYVHAGRGYGLADLAAHSGSDEPRAGGALALHVLDVMESLLTAADESRTVAVRSNVVRPAAVPLTDLTAI